MNEDDAMRASAEASSQTEARPTIARHATGFIASGLLAFAVDAGILWLLTRFAGLDPFSSRIAAILLAMVVAWLSHRRLTFAVTTPPSLAEFLRYAAVAWTAAAVNYAFYAGLLLIRPGLAPLLALVAATAISMAVTYLGLRFGVFRRP